MDRVSIPEAAYWALSAPTRRLIERYAHGGCLRVSDGQLHFEIAIYRWAEIEASMRQTTPHSDPQG